jgi:5-methylcytosine-specific restriction endonuclease McrA
VLVLNRFYIAVRVVTVRRAFIMLYSASAEVIHIEDGQFANYDFPSWCAMSSMQFSAVDEEDDFVRTVSLQIQIPRVVRLVRYERVPIQQLRFNRRNLLARDEHRCQYCGRTPPINQLSMDHVVPRSRGGETSWENVVCSCLTCNSKKGGRTPSEARMKLIRKPKQPRFNPILAQSLANPKYASWKSFLPHP